MIKIAFVLSFFIIIPTSYAAKTIASCEGFNIKSFEFSHCLDEVKDAADRELQTWINHHSFSLEEKAMISGRYSALKMFKRSQENFITFRENNCRWQYLTVSPDFGAAIAYQKCYIAMTNHRIEELKVSK